MQVRILSRAPIKDVMEEGFTNEEKKRLLKLVKKYPAVAFAIAVVGVWETILLRMRELARKSWN